MQVLGKVEEELLNPRSAQVAHKQASVDCRKKRSINREGRVSASTRKGEGPSLRQVSIGKMQVKRINHESAIRKMAENLRAKR